jgi:hypothetical protein
MENSETQSKRSKDGHEFENFIFNILERELGINPKIKLLRPRSQVYLPGSKRPHELSCMQITTPYGDIVGDTDIVIYHTKRGLPLMIISCKLSIRERLSQSIFHLYLYRKKYPDIKLFFVTKDKDLELGTLAKPNKNRILAESENVYCYSLNKETCFGGCIHPFETMITDIKRMAGINQ